MDEITSRWILEFFLRQQVNDWMLNKLFTVLPLPRADSNFKQCVLLKTIQSKITKNPISEKILTLIEQIEESHFRDGVRVPEEMKKAYCAAVVNCTLRFVDNEGLYMKAVKRIWKDRVCKMMRAEMSGLVSEELETWGDEIEEAAWEYSLRRKLLEKSKENDTVEVIKVYLAKAWEDLGPSFLEMVSDSLGDEKVREAFGLCDGVFSGFNRNEPDSPPISGIEAGTLKGVRIVDDTQELEEADTLMPKIAKNKEKKDAPNPSVDDNDNLKCKLAQSIMEPNSTARTDKWVDSIDELSEEGSSSEPDKSKSPSPKNRNASLLTINKSKKISKRRQKKIWSKVEEDTLRTGVQKYGKGNWKLILNMYREIFEERNEVDLKDKWRNISK